MTNQQQASSIFAARMTEIIALDFRGIGDENEINARYGWNYGWIIVNGESFNVEMANPGQFFPRFPADQGLND